jgi:hypothetical protein
MVTSVFVCDATHANIGQLPKGIQVAGYTTGTADIQWTAQDWAAHPDAARIDQDPAASGPTADILDIEAGAANPASAPDWVKRQLTSAGYTVSNFGSGESRRGALN